MTDIEFDQIRPGQTVRVHYGYSDSDTKATAEGVVASIDPAAGLLRPRWVCDLVLGTGRGRALPADARITRVELLAEPDPGWRVGQLAEIDAAYSEDNKTVGRLVRWGRDRRLGGNCWVAVDDMDSVWDDSKVTRRVLLKALPADARIVAQDAVVLPPHDGTGRPWNPDALRERAGRAECAGHASAAANLRTVANAIEAQS